MQAIQSSYALGISGFANDHASVADSGPYEACKAMILQALPEASFPNIVAGIKACPPLHPGCDQVQFRNMRKRIAACLFENAQELQQLLQLNFLYTPFLNISALQTRRARLLQGERKVCLELIGANELELAHQVLRCPQFFNPQDKLLDRWYFYLAAKYARLGDYEESLNILKSRVAQPQETVSCQELSQRIVSYIEEKALHLDTKTIDSEEVCSLLLNPKIVQELNERVKKAFNRHAQRGPRTCGRMLQYISTRPERIEAFERLRAILDRPNLQKLLPFVCLETQTSPQTEPLWETRALDDDFKKTILCSEY
jgi:tetratricopeptide (TPR) repeat protein